MQIVTINIQTEEGENFPISIDDNILNGIVTARANYDLFEVIEKIETALENFDSLSAIEEIREIISKQGVPK